MEAPAAAIAPGRRAGSTLAIANVSKRYGAENPAVDNVSLEITTGEFVTLLGASGSGKTTTLMIVAGFTAPDGGDVVLDGRSVVHLPPEKRGIGVVFQNYALFPHMTAQRNVAFPLRMRGIVPQRKQNGGPKPRSSASGWWASARVCRHSFRWPAAAGGAGARPRLRARAAAHG